MKKLLLSFVVLPGALATAQVGINTEEPQAMLDISAKDNQKGDLRIQDVEEKEKTDWLLIWDEKDQKVKRTSLSDLKWDIIVDKGKINYIRGKQPDRADEIINKIKQCAPENILFDKYFGNGKHDFVYCATTVSGDGYIRTWLNLNLGAAYADINSPNFNPTVNKTGEAIHSDENLYGSYYQWQRASDGHEFKNSPTTPDKAPSWTNTDDSAGKFITAVDDNERSESEWVVNGENAADLADYELWQAGRVNNPCPSGYHVPNYLEWQVFRKFATGSYDRLYNDRMRTQDKLPNLAAAGYRSHNDGSLRNDRSDGYYRSSSAVTYTQNAIVHFGSEEGVIEVYNHRADGGSVRCIRSNEYVGDFG